MTNHPYEENNKISYKKWLIVLAVATVVCVLLAVVGDSTINRIN